MWAAEPGLEGTGGTRAALAWESRGCEVGVLPQERVTGGLVPFPGQFLSLADGPGPLSPAPEAGGVHLDFTGTLLPAAVSALVCALCWCFMKVNEPWHWREAAGAARLSPAPFHLS